MKKDAHSDVLEKLRNQVQEVINRDYKTVEEFCWEKDLNKATMSNFLRGKKDFQVSTLVKIANALEKKLIIRLE